MEIEDLLKRLEFIEEIFKIKETYEKTSQKENDEKVDKKQILKEAFDSIKTNQNFLMFCSAIQSLEEKMTQQEVMDAMVFFLSGSAYRSGISKNDFIDHMGKVFEITEKKFK